MRLWLIVWLGNFLQSLLGRTRPPDSTEGAEETSEEEQAPPCPICGEDWEKGEVFCYHCGYEPADERLPLHPPPERTGSVNDPDGALDGDDRRRLEDRFASLEREKGWDVVVLVLSSDLRIRIGPDAEDGRAELIDGLAFNLYNTWQVGKDTHLKGLLLVVDPAGAARALALGRNGPRLSGSTFRQWLADFYPPENVNSADGTALLAAELDHLADCVFKLSG